MAKVVNTQHATTNYMVDVPFVYASSEKKSNTHASLIETETGSDN